MIVGTIVKIAVGMIAKINRARGRFPCRQQARAFDLFRRCHNSTA